MLLDDLLQRRRESRSAADELVTRANGEDRDLTAEELAQYRDHLAAEREAGDRIDAERDAQLREVRAAVARDAQPDAYALGNYLRRAIDESGGLGAAVTPPEFAATVWDRLAATAVGLLSGFTVVTTERDSLVLPRVTADTQASWTDEGDPITPTDAVGDTVTAVPRKLAGIQVVSNETLADSSPSVAQIIANGLVRSIALEADAAFYEGTGTPPEIRGLENVSGIQTIPSVGLLADLDPFVDAFEALQRENATPTAIVMHPTAWGDVARLKENSTDSNKPLLQDSAGSGSQAISRQIYGVPVYVTSQIDPVNIFVYQADQVVVVRRQEVRVETDSSRLFNSDQSEIRAIARLDLVVPNPLAVCLLENVQVS
jgi:HK97 family phage major capsid protein